MKKIGIIGLGFVGGAIQQASEKEGHECCIIDPAKGFNASYQEMANQTDGVFVCVPTPMGDNGVCDTSFLENVLEQLKSVDYTGVIISKCTAPPNTYKQLNELYPNLVHAPEFLTAANAVTEYRNGKFSIIGGKNTSYMLEAERIIKTGQPYLGANIQHCSIGEAALAKYAINSFLATKVMFMNDIYQVAIASNLNYNTVADMVTMDARIGSSHMQVPGPDGQFGFGGACFPKDTNALLKYAESLGLTMDILEAAVQKNLLVRLTESK